MEPDVGWAQMQLQRALYHEQRHGHDRQTAEMREHTAAMTKLRGALVDYADTMARALRRGQ